MLSKHHAMDCNNTNRVDESKYFVQLFKDGARLHYRYVHVVTTHRFGFGTGYAEFTETNACNQSSQGNR